MALEACRPAGGTWPRQPPPHLAQFQGDFLLNHVEFPVRGLWSLVAVSSDELGHFRVWSSSSFPFSIFLPFFLSLSLSLAFSLAFSLPYSS
jgi:hypothetical protein